MASKREIVTKVENAVLYSDGTILVKNVRASYAHLHKPQASENDDGTKGEPKYSVVGMLPKKTHKAAAQLIIKRRDEILAEKKMKIAKDKFCLKDGDDSDKEEYAGHWTLSARESRKPALRNKDKSKIEDSDGDVLYSGCYINMLVRLWPQDNKFGKRVNAGLSAVQFFKDGEPFGEGRLSDEDLDDTFDDDDDGDGGFGGDDDDGL
jgi:hypothetical protein